ncbi:MAG: aminoacyl-tRNA hydrolase [Chloroflexota bacterium]|nr:aminoacyl-tRNA hydrolase [Chloroflexota bacterium]
MADWFLIVGLGNPGAQYERTRHNIGFRVVDELARKHGLTFSKIEQRAQVAAGTILGKRALLAKPLTFMNLSGDSVVPLARFYKVEPASILIISDDLDIPLGTLRIRQTGSSGGQNGVKHILERMGTQNIARVRVGIGRPPGRMDAAGYVLTPFKGDEEITALEMIDRAAKAAETWLTDGVEIAMTRYNGTGETKKLPEKPPKQPDPVKPSES